MTTTNSGPVLAEQEMMHDGEPIYDLAWGAGTSKSGDAPADDRLGRLPLSYLTAGAPESPSVVGKETGALPPFAPNSFFRGEGFAETPCKRGPSLTTAELETVAKGTQ